LNGPTKISRARAWLLKAIISIVLLAWVFTRIDLTMVWITVNRLDLQLYLLLLFIYGLAVLVSALKWRLLLPQRDLTSLLQASFIGQFYTLVLPGQLAGEVMKAYRLGQGRRDAEQVAASVVVDKATGLLALILVGFVGLYVARPNIPPLLVHSLLVVFVCGFALLFSMKWLFLYESLQRLAERLHTQIRILRPVLFRVQFILLEWRKYLAMPTSLTASVLMGLLFQVVNLIIILLLSLRFEIILPPFTWFWIFAFVSLAVLLPLSVGGIGVREGAYVGLLGYLGVAAPLALALSLTIFSLQLVAALVGAVVELIGVREDLPARR
jgi:uncharacterized protein (TIRG00374 family)